jgi:hypothetical protein
MKFKRNEQLNLPAIDKRFIDEKIKQIIILFLAFLVFIQCGQKPITANVLSSTDAKLNTHKFSLDTLERRTFQWFWDLVDKNFQTPDRHPQRSFSSIAATGFGLTANCIGAERHYVTREQAAERTLKTLQFLWNAPQGGAVSGMSGFHGFYYHFLDHETGLRFKDVELSSIDTGLLMSGVLSVMSYFDGNNPVEKQIQDLSDKLYRRVEWSWFLNEKKNLSMGYHPEKGFLSAEWIGYNEGMSLLLMAIGSPTHPIPADCWERWCKPYPWATFKGQEHVNFDPLFGHQYSQMYIDFKGIADPYMAKKGFDYFENSRRATYANRQYCVDNASVYKNYSVNEWGLTACDGAKDTTVFLDGHKQEFWSYRARGAASTQIIDDGTISPTAVGGSIPFAPEICLPALENLWTKYNSTLVTEYGFKDAYNPTYTFGKGNEKGWVDVDCLGIDQGPILIQIENYRSQFVWKLMRKNPYIVAGLKKAGFKGGWLEK